MDAREELAESATDYLREFEATATTTVSSPLEQVDEATRVQTETVIRDLYACYNAGNALAALALVSEGAIDRMPPELRYLVGSVFPADPAPRTQDEMIGYADIGPVGRLADGRVAVVVTTITPASPTRETQEVLWLLDQEDDRLLIDGVLVAPPGREFEFASDAR
jgi:hypothetical protein